MKQKGDMQESAASPEGYRIDVDMSSRRNSPSNSVRAKRRPPKDSKDEERSRLLEQERAP